MRRPNAYQTRADLMSDLVRDLMARGNGFAVGFRNDRSEISEVHRVQHLTPVIDRETRAVFYACSSPHELLPPAPIEGRLWPARDVLHLRLYTPRHPLVGVSPIEAAALAISTGATIQSGVDAFMSNMVRPSGYLAIPQGVTLSPLVLEQLRQDWGANAEKQNQGRMGVLQSGVEWKQLKMEALDSAVPDFYRMTVADVARAFRVPLQLLGETGGTTYSSTEHVIRHWLSTGLAPLLERIELSLDHLFGLGVGEYTELETEYLLRSDFLSRIDGLTKAVQGGLMTPDEARSMEGLPRIEGGSSAFLQRQMVPIDKIGPLLDAETARAAAPDPQPDAAPAPDDTDPPPEAAAAPPDPEVTRALVRDLIRTKETASA
jgi:HK97 family phage portal protein